MSSDSLPPVVSSPPGSTASPARKRRRWLLFGCGGLLALLLIIVATVAFTLWWIQRPIKPVVLSEKEKATVEQKLERVGASEENRSRTSARRDVVPKTEPDRSYAAGGKTLQLTERELNGLLNANTDLGKTVRIELGRDAINAYLAVPIPQDFPVGGGKMFRARGRFRVSLSNDQSPFAILEDVTVMGLSLPKDWLGGLKGENLLGDAMGKRNGRPILSGVKSLHIVPGAIVLEVND